MERSISVIIADRPYRLKVTEDQEEKVRKAAKLINHTMKELSGVYHFRDKQDLLAMAALQAAVQKDVDSRQSETQEEQILTAIEKIETLVSGL
jgi:cell division protein ZapA